MTRDEAARRLYFRIYHLPAQLERARARVRHLEAEARRYGMDHLFTDDELLADPHWINTAIEDEAASARR